jgi:hypothetical protein
MKFKGKVRTLEKRRVRHPSREIQFKKPHTGQRVVGQSAIILISTSR